MVSPDVLHPQAAAKQSRSTVGSTCRRQALIVVWAPGWLLGHCGIAFSPFYT